MNEFNVHEAYAAFVKENLKRLNNRIDEIRQIKVDSTDTFGKFKNRERMYEIAIKERNDFSYEHCCEGDYIGRTYIAMEDISINASNRHLIKAINKARRSASLWARLTSFFIL